MLLYNRVTTRWQNKLRFIQIEDVTLYKRFNIQHNLIKYKAALIHMTDRFVFKPLH